jgi:hypothetical protein
MNLEMKKGLFKPFGQWAETVQRPSSLGASGLPGPDQHSADGLTWPGRAHAEAWPSMARVLGCALMARRGQW